MGEEFVPSLLSTFNQMFYWSNQYAGVLFVLGIIVVLFRQWLLWQQDKYRLAEIQATPALPSLEEWSGLPRVSALVAAWNEAEHIQAHIQSFLNLRYPHKQLVLVAGGLDGTFELARKYAGEQVVVLEQIQGEGKQRALRRGLEYTQGEIIYLTDADCVLDDWSFNTVLYPLASGKEYAATGTLIPTKVQITQPFIFTQVATQLYGNYMQNDHASGLQGCNCAIDRQVLVNSGGLQVEAPSGTDYVLAKMLTRAGIAILQVPSSQVVSEFPSSIRSYYRQQVRWMRNVVRIGKQFKVGDETRAVWINALSGWVMLAIPLLVFILGPVALAAWGLLILYGLLARIRYGIFTARILKIRISPYYWLYIPGYLFLDFAVWAGAIPRFFRKRMSWQ